MTAPSSAAWGHLLRDIHDQRTLYPDDAPLAKWADAVHGIYGRAKACTHPQAKRRRTAQLALERQLLALGQPFRHDPSATQGKLCRRIERHIKELFVFVAEPEVPAAAPARSRAPSASWALRKIQKEKWMPSFRSDAACGWCRKDFHCPQHSLCTHHWPERVKSNPC